VAPHCQQALNCPSSHSLRAPMSLEKMSYDAATGTVI